MSSLNHQAMDVDGPSNGPGTLKRCSSAPMINETSSSVMTASSSSGSAREPPNFTLNFAPLNATRTRRFSASYSQVPGSPVSSLSLTPRINQLRQEEHDVISNSRELAHEREIHSAMQISQSWEDLNLMSESQNDTKGNRMGPIHVSLPANNFACNSPSPTRCYGFQSPTRSRPTFTKRRSESPVFRPSPLGGVKRKLDERDSDFHTSPRTKRVYSYSGERGLLTTTTISLPGSLSSVGTPESLSSADSPGSGYTFRNVDSPSPTQSGGAGEPMIVGKTDHDMAESPS
ncbi:P2R1A-PPP2R2A-interacting phosphatase regulator 1 [Cylas formicarius]|uniref:P2R1A-PPP2R2A-interacting phosphatase regulator 1 n=1 Tax=Cylas formicarius TaxID=197179 RepID=UPI00295881E4|nr:P2R1A-PPP2R2A-interacting phosphatase regulator 1 [Cylas formicarius]